MADYGVRCFNASGVETFNTLFNAGRGMKVFTATSSGSLTDPVLAQGTPWWSWAPEYVETPRNCVITVSGTTLTWTLQTTGLSVAQIGTPVRIKYGVK